MVCPNCGARQADGARFCENCGTRLVSSRPSAQEDAFYGYAGGTPRLAPGYSRKLDSEPVLAALKKQRRAVRIAAVVLVVLPLVGFLIYGALSSAMDMGQALFTGVIVSAVFALATLITLIKQKLARSFEGTVIDKKHIRRIGRSTRAGRRSRSRWRVTIEGEDGKRRKKDVTPTVFSQ